MSTYINLIWSYYFFCVPARNRSKLGLIRTFDISLGKILLHKLTGKHILSMTSCIIINNTIAEILTSNFVGTQWRNPFRRRGRDGIIPTTSGEATSGRNYEFSTSHERQFQFPMSWFSRRGEKQISTTRGRASSGRNSFFHYNC